MSENKHNDNTNSSNLRNQTSDYIQSSEIETMTIVGLHEALSSYKLFNNQKQILDDLLVYNEDDTLEDTVKYYTSLLQDFLNQLENCKMSAKDKNSIKALVTAFLSVRGQNDCLNIMLQEQNLIIQDKDDELNEVYSKWQKDRDALNELLIKNNQKPKEAKIRRRDNLEFSVTREDPTIPIDSAAALALFKKNRNNSRLNNKKLIRVSAKDENGKAIKNTKTVFCKKTNTGYDNLIQK